MNIKELKEGLRQIVREEIRSSMSEMLREILTEAVNIASKPDTKPVSTSMHVPFKLDTDTSSTGSGSLLDLLQETQRSMSRDDYASIMDGNGGVNISSGTSTQVSGEMIMKSVDDLPAFAKNAKAIFDASFKK